MKEPGIIKLKELHRKKYSYKRTGNVAVDMVHALIRTYQPLVIREIFLCPNYYSVFEQYVKFQMVRAGKEWTPGQRMSHSGVDIKKRIMVGSKIQWVFEKGTTGEA